MHHRGVFISYSHRGNGLGWKELVCASLGVFERHSLLDPWHDEATELGEAWHPRINAAMQGSQVAILLLTKEFLESEFVAQFELPVLQELHQVGKLRIAPILCEPCAWQEHEWLKSLQIKPRVLTDPTPLSAFADEEQQRWLRELALEIALGVRDKALEALGSSEVVTAKKIDLIRFPIAIPTGPMEEKLIGREQELAMLDLAYSQPGTAVLSLVAWGGVGKSMLVKHWLRGLEQKKWPGADMVYAWSFFSQGTKEDRQASEDLFLTSALEWFGVQCEPTLSAWDKGRLLAHELSSQRTLLILDGIEPLQYPPGPMGGQLRAPGVQSLLKHLARRADDSSQSGLCLVTTREPLTDLANFQRREGAAWGSVLRIDLGNLAEEAGAALLYHVGANRAGAAEIKPDDKELLAASREVDGHALTLNLLGRFLARAHGGDIRRRDLVKFDEADRKELGGTTFKMLAAFENWFAKSGEFGARQLAVLRMLGLFDRPADAGCIGALRKPPVISGLTDPLFTMRLDANAAQANVQPIIDEDWNIATSFLSDFGLVAIQAESTDSERLIDCHPLIREHFANQISVLSEPWRTAHRRLFEYLQDATQDQPKPTLEELQPLYQAVSHGSHAGLIEEARANVYFRRILRGREGYSTHKLGALSTDLTALACMFEKPWSRLSQQLANDCQAWVLAETGYCLRELGRLAEAVEPICESLNRYIHKQNAEAAAQIGGNLSELRLILGSISQAVQTSENTIFFADLCGVPAYRISARTECADALFQASRVAEALVFFKAAEALQVECQSKLPLLYSLRGFQYCELLLTTSEQAAWQPTLRSQSIRDPQAAANCDSVEQRAKKTFSWVAGQNWLLDSALNHLTLGRTSLYLSLIGQSPDICRQKAHEHIQAAVVGLQNSGVAHHIPRALISRSWLRYLQSDLTGARADLDDALDIAERGPMRLHLADIHLYRVRLFFREKHYPWTSPQADLTAAEKLVNGCGYHRRDQELAEAKHAILDN